VGSVDSNADGAWSCGLSCTKVAEVDSSDRQQSRKPGFRSELYELLIDWDVGLRGL
jgi:hypothetical protein